MEVIDMGQMPSTAEINALTTIATNTAANNKMYPADMNNLKTQVKYEMSRRRYTGQNGKGDLEDNFKNFTTTPAQNGTIWYTQADETIGHMNKINSHLAIAKNGVCNSISAAVTKFKSTRQRYTLGQGTDCSTNCTGLCHDSCQDTCWSLCYDLNGS